MTKPEHRVISKEEFDEAAQRAAEAVLAEAPIFRHEVLVDGVWWPLRIDPTTGHVHAGDDPEDPFAKRVLLNMWATALVGADAANRIARKLVSEHELEVERARWLTVCGKAIVSHATNAGSMPPEFLAQAFEVVTR